jgi:hypothetical protein
MRNLPFRWFFLRQEHQPGAETRSDKIGVGLDGIFDSKLSKPRFGGDPYQIG